MATNPFRASFGASPPLLVGRDEVIESFIEALEDGPGSSGRATLYTGARGAGKTVMLNAVQEQAEKREWRVITETATPGFVHRITHQHLPQLLNAIDPKASRTRLRGLTGPLNVGGASWGTEQTHVSEPSLRSQIEQATDLLGEYGHGLLITLDEIHRNQTDELRELATAVQHAVREGRELAFVGCGLAASISDLLNDEVLTFLRRADRHVLGPVSDVDVRRAFRDPIEDAGRHINDEALDVMVEGARGYPFLVQLVGYQTWRLQPQTEEIGVEDAIEGVARARRRLGSLVHQPALAAASAVDKSFLVAMAQDDGPSKMADIGARLDVDGGYASQYRLRLIAAELIVPSGHGRVDFALPYLRTYLREHAVTDL